MTPITNTWAAIGAVVVAVAVVVLQALDAFLSTGQAWPTTIEGWLHVLLPAVVAGLLASVFPHYSTHEAQTGMRFIQQGRDAPVVSVPKDTPKPPG